MTDGTCERCGAFDELQEDLGRLVCWRCVLPLRPTGPHERRPLPAAQRTLI